MLAENIVYSIWIMHLDGLTKGSSASGVLVLLLLMDRYEACRGVLHCIRGCISAAFPFSKSPGMHRKSCMRSS